MSGGVKNTLALSAFVAVCVGGGALSGLLTQDSVRTWYPTLEKPAFNPPAWVFAPVWTILYALMGVAAFLVWRQLGRGRDRLVMLALGAFAGQLLLNLAWTPVFFGARSILGGLIVILVLLAAIVVTVVLFFRVTRPAGAILLPYLAWVAFATVLNASLYTLNR
jgi:translocator protein